MEPDVIISQLFTYIHLLQLNSLIMKTRRESAPLVFTSIKTEISADDKPKDSTPGINITRVYGQLRSVEPLYG